ncbi:MAG: acyl carrier protein [Polyangiales bacterium]
MTESEVRARLQTVFRSVFDNDSIVLADEMTANDVDGWDSLTHVDLIVGAEKAFAVKLATKDVKRLANVGDFVKLLTLKIGG